MKVVPAGAVRGGCQREREIGLERFGLPFGSQQPTRGVADGAGGERTGRLVHQDLARAREPAQSRGGVHRVADDGEPGRLRRRRDHHLARADAGMHRRQQDPAAIPVPAHEVLPHGERRANRSLGVVLVRDRHPEDRHEPVALHVGDRPAERLDDDDELVHRRPQEGVDLLGVERLRERRVPRQVGEQHRDELALADERAARGALGCAHGVRLARRGANGVVRQG